MFNTYGSVLLVIVIVMLLMPPSVDDSASFESSTLGKTVNLIKEDVKDGKTFFGSNQQQNSASSISKKNLKHLKPLVYQTSSSVFLKINYRRFL